MYFPLPAGSPLVLTALVFSASAAAGLVAASVLVAFVSFLAGAFAALLPLASPAVGSATLALASAGGAFSAGFAAAASAAGLAAAFSAGLAAGFSAGAAAALAGAAAGLAGASYTNE